MLWSALHASVERARFLAQVHVAVQDAVANLRLLLPLDLLAFGKRKIGNGVRFVGH